MAKKDFLSAVKVHGCCNLQIWLRWTLMLLRPAQCGDRGHSPYGGLVWLESHES